MINEDYVSFETAKLLKEKGFDVYGDGSYDSGIEIYKEYSPFGKLNSCTTSKPHREAYAAPTLQMAMKWLREVHNLAIELTWEHTWFASITKMTSIPESIVYEDGNRSYEQACEDAIKYCLENLV